MLINFRKIKSATGIIITAFKKYKRKFTVLVILGFLSGLFAAVGIGAVIPLFFLITNQISEETNFISQKIENIFSLLHIPLTPQLLILFIVSLFILKALVQFAARYINAKTIAQFEEETRKDLFEKTLKTTWPHLLNQKVGYLEGVILYDIERGTIILGLLSNSILTATSFLMYASVAFSISIYITLLTIGIGGIIFFALKPLHYRARKLFGNAAAIYKVVSHHINENIIGAKIIKATSTESKVAQKGQQYFKELRDIKIKASLYKQFGVIFIEPLSFILIGILFIFSYQSPTFSIAAFAVIIYLIQKMFSFIQAMQAQLHLINELIPYLKTAHDYRLIAINNKEIDSGENNFSFKDKLEFKNIRFSYESKKEILSNINFSIKRGEMIGLIGSSGTGKTTVVDLLLRLFTPGAGEIIIDGKNISKINLTDWRKNIGYVPQDVFLLNDSIENNIRFYDDSISKKNIIEATKMANIYDTIQNLPDKFETIVGERGIKLSGGQRQRIALARALARKPQILVLDEATSAIDSESEMLIQKAINSLKGEVTVLIIAHRPSTVMNVDNLIVLEKGKIIEEGSPATLLKNKNSYFYKIHKMVENR